MKAVVGFDRVVHLLNRIGCPREVRTIFILYYNAFITRHTSGLKTCSEALTNIQYRISNYAQQLRTLLK